MIAALLAAGVVWLNQAKERGRQLVAYGRLSQMRLALQMYEDDYGTLPPLSLRDNAGTPTQSWRALISQYLGGRIKKQLEQLDLKQPWNSDHNRGIIDKVSPNDWAWFALDGSRMALPVTTKLLAYVGGESFWDAGTGLPVRNTTDHPAAVLLVWIPKGNLHPLQPGDITEEEVRERVEQGERVFFIATGEEYGYGIITIERGELAFHTWQEELDRGEGRR
jgi:hypothetical protein